jgi:hypothetical protein
MHRLECIHSAAMDDGTAEIHVSDHDDVLHHRQESFLVYSYDDDRYLRWLKEE